MKKSILYLFLSVSLWSCTKETIQPEPIPDPVEKPEPKPEEPKITASDLNFSASFDTTFENTIYPSYILAYAAQIADNGGGFKLIELKSTSPKTDATLKVVIGSTEINKETVFQTITGRKGRGETYYPIINWDYEKLKYLDQPGTVDIPFTVYLDGNELENKTIKVKYRSANECITGRISNTGVFIDMDYTFAAYVNENNPHIDPILQEALQPGIVNNFDGYQSEDEGAVLAQVYSIWYLLQSKGVKYSSITNTSNPTDKIWHQYVRFFDEVYNNTQANCVDGSVFISSILKKIGIMPFLVTKPGHMYMGFYLDKNRKKIALLETTMLGWADLSKDLSETDLNHYHDLGYLSDNTYAGYYNGSYSMEYVKKEISLNSFYAAVNYRNEEYESYRDKLNSPGQYEYGFYDIDELRKDVQPIGR